VEASLEAAAEAHQEVGVASARQEVVVVSQPVDAVEAEAVSAQGVVDSAVVAARLGAEEEEEDAASAGKLVRFSVKENGIGTAFRGVNVRDSVCAWFGIRTMSTGR